MSNPVVAGNELAVFAIGKPQPVPVITVPVTMSATDTTASVELSEGITERDVEVGISVTVIEAPDYTGEYVFTPSSEAQTISISGYRATQDIIINPVPPDYGKITWDGSTLMVS